MLAEPAVPPYVLAGDGSCSEACLMLEAEPLMLWPVVVVGIAAVEGSLAASTLPLSGVAGEPAMSSYRILVRGMGMTGAGMLSIEGKEGARAWNKL